MSALTRGIIHASECTQLLAQNWTRFRRGNRIHSLQIKLRVHLALGRNITQNKVAAFQGHIHMLLIYTLEKGSCVRETLQ